MIIGPIVHISYCSCDAMSFPCVFSYCHVAIVFQGLFDLHFYRKKSNALFFGTKTQRQLQLFLCFVEFLTFFNLRLCFTKLVDNAFSRE